MSERPAGGGCRSLDGECDQDQALGGALTQGCALCVEQAVVTVSRFRLGTVDSFFLLSLLAADARPGGLPGCDEGRRWEWVVEAGGGGPAGRQCWGYPSKLVQRSSGMENGRGGPRRLSMYISLSRCSRCRRATAGAKKGMDG